MKTKLTILALIGITFDLVAQTEVRNPKFLLGTFHQPNQNINGLSVGLWPSLDNDFRNVYTNGIKLEAIGFGLGVPLIPRSPVAVTEEQFQAVIAEPPSERINGLNLSGSGSVGDCITNGVSVGFIGQINREVSGVSASVMMNLSQKHSGLQVAMFNESYLMNGLQIGLGNYGRKTRGIQIGITNNSGDLRGLQFGLWNVNQKRKLPILNWNFKS